MDPVKDAFDKVKQDTEFLKYELNTLRKGLIETRERITSSTKSKPIKKIS